MKRIPHTYWEENYDDIPTLLQRAWVQRWLELLDPNTSYIYAPPVVNIIGVLDELVNGFESDRERTCYFLLRELVRCCDTCPVLRGSRAPIARVNEEARELLNTADGLLEWNGCEKKGIPDKKNKRQEFAAQVQERRQGLFRDALDWLREEDRYRHLLCCALEERLADPVSDTPMAYRDIDVLSKNLIAELLTEGNYSASFLSDRCVKEFLRPRGGEDFAPRLAEFLSGFRRPHDKFTVYMRVQAHRVVRDIRRIDLIAFRESVPEMLSVTERISEQNGWRSQDERRAKDFFYHGQAPENLIFAIAADIRAEDAHNAAAQALDRLATAIQQAKFEYELRGFSIDRRVYVHNQTRETLTFVSTKQLQRARCGLLGDPVRLERLTTWLSFISGKYRAQQGQRRRTIEQSIVDKVTDTALAWHRDALDADTVETQFLDHWISLEQVFKPFRGKVDCKESTGDKAVLALAKVLQRQFKTQLVLDLWGDIRRCGALGPPRVVVPYDGYVEYSDALLGMPKLGRLRFVPDDVYSRPELSLICHERRHTFRLRPGTVVLVGDREHVGSGEWLAGAFIHPARRADGVGRLFQRLAPNVENLLYLAFYEHHVSAKAGRDVPYQTGVHPGVWLEERSSAIRAMRRYDQIERLMLDLIRFTNWEDSSISMNPPGVRSFLDALPALIERHVTKAELDSTTVGARLKAAEEDVSRYLPFFDLYTTLRTQGVDLLADRDLPDLVRFEAFRNQTPDVDVMMDVFSGDTVDLDTDQPLLELRLRQVREFFRYGGDWLLPDFIAEADRMRRVRNEIVHSGRSPGNLDLLVLQLYKYTRVYLREVMYAMARDRSGSLVDWLHLDLEAFRD